MRSFSSLEVTMALALPLLVASRGATAAPPSSTPASSPTLQIIQLWTSTDKGGFFTFADAADGTSSPDPNYAAQKEAQLGGSAVAVVTDGMHGFLVLGTLQGNQFSALATLPAVANQTLTYLIGHLKSADGKSTFDGTVNATSDLKSGLFQGVLTETASDGKSSRTTHIRLSLATPTQSTGTGSNPPSSTPSTSTGTNTPASSPSGGGRPPLTQQ